MSWDPTWEDVFRTHDWGKYPPEELIRFVARNFYNVPDRKKVKLLEIGCGTGANVWYAAREGFDVCGVDGAPTAIEKAKRRMTEERVTAELHVGDLVHLREMFEPESFDGVVDVACLQHNRRLDAQRVLVEVLSVLKGGGKLFSMLLAAGTSGDGLGTEVEPGTFVDITEGPLKGRGLSHFFTFEDVELLMRPFTDVQIEYSTRSMGGRKQEFRMWVVEARKDPATPGV